MTLSARQRRALDSIEQQLRAREPRLASMFAMFTRLAKDDLPPATETIEVRRWQWLAELTAALIPRRRRQHLRTAGGAVTRFVNVAFVPFIVLSLLITAIVLGGHGPSANRCGQALGYHSIGVPQITTAKCGIWPSQFSRWHPQ